MSENFGKSQFYDATTRDFRAKSGQYSNGHFSFNYQAILIVKHHKTQNVKLYKVGSSKFQHFDFLPCIFEKKQLKEKYSIKFSKIKFEKTVEHMYHPCMDYIYAKCQVNRFENGFHTVQKLQKCP